MLYQSVLMVRSIEDVTIVNFIDKEIRHLHQIEQICQELYDLTDSQNTKKIILDFSKVQSLSSQVLGILLKTKDRAEQAGSQIVLCGINHNISLLFKISRQEKLFTFYKSEDDALASFGITSVG